jgi:hypothetical protein
MDYKDYSYLWPPRPSNAIPEPLLGFYEKRGFVAQVKKNGTCTVIFAKGNQVIYKTRHKDDHKMWSPTPEHNRFFQGSQNWEVYVAELLHSKTPHIKNQLYIFDKIVHNGVHLVGTTFEDRQDILHGQFHDGVDEGFQTRVHDNVGIANCYRGDFAKLFAEIETHGVEDEGLVLKNPKATLRACMKQGANDAWQVKCRRPHKNYGF